jgi:arylsulfatase A-like enzyme
MRRRDFLGLAAFAAMRPLLGAPARKPNIIVILSDDQGWGETSIQGCKDIPTPNIDTIARSGVRFTNGYVSCPVCSPTRAGLMTGRYQQRFGHEFNPGPALAAAENFGLPLTETAFPAWLKPLGYATGMVGKWHLGYKPEYHPLKRGFDEFFGFLGGAHSYVDALQDPANPILRGTEKVDEKEYLTDAFGREAATFIDRHKNGPFFLYLAFNAVHAPLQAMEKYLSRFPSISDTRRKTFAAMTAAKDDAVGKVLAKLREHKIEENTLIFYLSDNGGPTLNTTSQNGPLRGYKGQVLEGGIRVPFMVQWKARLRGGQVYEKPVISLDILPTAVAAAGGKPSPLWDGVDLMPYLTGKSPGAPHEILCWRFGSQWAIRKGDWKLLAMGTGQPELYNLAADIGESKNLAASNPAKVKELQAAYDAWNAKNINPRWGVPDRRRGRKGEAKAGRKKKR